MIRFWLWIERHWFGVFVYGSMAVCLLLLALALTGVGGSPRFDNFRWDHFR